MRGHDEQTSHMFSYVSPEQRVLAIGIAAPRKGMNFPCDLHSTVAEKVEGRKELCWRVVCPRDPVAELGACCDQLFEGVERVTPATKQTTTESGEAVPTSALSESKALRILELHHSIDDQRCDFARSRLIHV